jgi:hypothetical protein
MPIPREATRVRIEARFTLPIEGVTFQSAAVEVRIKRAGE